MQFTNVLSQIGGGADYRDHFVCLSQLWSSPWGFGGSAPGCIDGLSLKIGKLHVLASFLALLLGVVVWRKAKDKVFTLGIIFLCTLIGIVLMLQISQPIWESTRYMAFFQYPWRFLIIVTLSASFIS